MDSVELNKLYTEDETRQLLGNIGKTKLHEYRKANCIVPFRLRPTMYLGEDIERAKGRIMELRRSKSEYGIKEKDEE